MSISTYSLFYFNYAFYSLLHYSTKVIFYYLAGLSILTNLLISSFHSLVERKIINYDGGCTSKINEFDNIDELRNFWKQYQLQNATKFLLNLGFLLG